MSATIAPTRWPVKELVCGFDRPGGGWLEVKGRIAGPCDAPASLVIGGVSAGRRLIEDENGKGWWPGVAEAGGALDPSRRRLISFDFIGEDAPPFPTLADQAAAALAVCEAAGVDRLSLVGASFGGVIALKIAAHAPDRIRRVDILAAAARPNPMATAWRSVQRDIVELAVRCGDGAAGVDIARRMAMTTYRTSREFDQRFADPDPDGRDAAGVQTYLATAGGRFADAMSPERFLALSRSMDSADPNVENITAPVRFLAIRSDQLVPPRDIHRTAARMDQTAVTVTEIDSLYGHDGFLKEVDAVNAFLRAG